ncbi:tetratricopeptide repeat protein [Pelodictyon luteolum]|uniref:TPR repeat n=1 Tax=Chlorobium luteolum (strain DSM 273 / BCRC 81028 / 2530) TaxID=319225 RepID=Q3B5L3_CHLL3|nr:tetratricopeptide repeat protein [Pelodictyon luteolum]ABB23368.1 TPR repeat [Pelodictyon luteolum DSM 273]
MNDNDIQPIRTEEKKTAVDNLLYFAIRYKNLIAGALILILIGGAAIFFWTERQASRENEAAPMMAAAAMAFDRGDFQRAIDGTEKEPGLKTIAEQYNGTPSGEMAELLLANAYYAIGKPKDALKAFDAASPVSPDLAAAAIAGKASCQSDLQQYDAAAKSFLSASEKAENNALKAQYLMAAADCRLGAGDTEKAGELFGQVVDRYPGSSGARAAQQALWKISGMQEVSNK